jgi:hypothetical protein
MTTLNEAITKACDAQLLFTGVRSRIRPHERLIGKLTSACPDAQWVTTFDDRNPTMGPGSFDIETVRWWATRADIIVVDTADRHREKSRLLGRAVAEGHRLLVVETVESHREGWRQLLREVGHVNSSIAVMAFRNGNAPGVLHFSLGRLGTDFSADPPPFTG